MCIKQRTACLGKTDNITKWFENHWKRELKGILIETVIFVSIETSLKINGLQIP